MKANDIEVTAMDGEVWLVQETGTEYDESGPQIIKLTTDQIGLVCLWLRQTAPVAAAQQRATTP